jgi:hypothetical protein
VSKKDGTVRVCVDYTRFNGSVQRENYQLPLAEEIFAKGGDAKFFSTLDAAAGFWQILLESSSSELTTLITSLGRYRFERLPFGLSSGPEVFHKAMQETLWDIEGTDCFIDDVLVCGATSEEHDRRLRRVLSRFRERGVRLQPAQCKFRLPKVTYYGHELSAKGIKVSEAKLQAIAKMKRQENKEDVRRFLGMIAYVAKFLEGLSEISAPIRALLQDDMTWDWTSVHEAAFQRLKDMLTAAPVLAYYSPWAPTIVSADASSFGLGAVLLQEQSDGRRAPVTYIKSIASK